MSNNWYGSMGGRKVVSSLLIVWALVVTVARSAHTVPTTFAAAHWLLDYRFGFAKRALPGSLLSLATAVAGTSISEHLISVISMVFLIAFFLMLLVLTFRLVSISRWSIMSIVVGISFLSSPLIVMQAHIIGYYDNIVYMMTAVSVILVLQKHLWMACLVQMLAIPIHEASILIGYPLVIVAWWLGREKCYSPRLQLLNYAALALPPAGFVTLAVCQAKCMNADFPRLFSLHLAEYDFITQTSLPKHISTNLLYFFETQSPQFMARICSGYGLMLPALLSLFFFMLWAFKVRVLSVEGALVLAAVFAPSLLHLVAWDTARIWTYSVMSGFMLCWIAGETKPWRGTPGVPDIGVLLGLITMVCHMTNPVPLMSGFVENVGTMVRLALYLPLLIAVPLLVLHGQAESTNEVIR